MCSKRKVKKWNKGSGAFGSRHHSANPETLKGKSLRDFLFVKATALEILCKCKSRRQPGFSPRSLQNLAVWALWFWLKGLEGHRRKGIFLCS